MGSRRRFGGERPYGALSAELGVNTVIDSYSVFLKDVPSENSLYPTNFKTGIRFLSKKGSEFRKRAVLAFKEAGFPRFATRPLVVELTAYWRDKRKCDMANYHKAIGDALKAGGFIEDDWILLFRDQKFYYPGDEGRKLEKGVQGFIVQVSERER